MSLILVGKIIGGLFLTGTSSVALIWFIDKEILGIFQDVHLYMISTELTGANSAAVDLNTSNDEHLQCKIDDLEAIDCEINKLQDNEETKQHRIINFHNNSNEKLNISDLKTANNIFKVRFQGNKKIEKKEITEIKVILKKNKTEHAKLKTLIREYKRKIILKSNYLVVKMSDVKGTINCNIDDKQPKCLLNGKDKVECEIFDFTETETISDQKTYKELKFKKSNGTKSTTIEKDKHYLIKLNNNINVENLNIQNLYCEDSDTNRATFKFKTFSIVDDNNENMFSVS